MRKKLLLTLVFLILGILGYILFYLSKTNKVDSLVTLILGLIIGTIAAKAIDKITEKK